MYAVVRTGSKQYKVSPGDRITVEKLEVPEGKKYTFEEVVLYHDGENLVASPRELAKVKVAARVLDQGRTDKTLVYKYKRTLHVRVTEIGIKLPDLVGQQHTFVDEGSTGKAGYVKIGLFGQLRFSYPAFDHFADHK